ncbi:MAG: hypothetical protein ACJAVV_003930, partial [Alphaproteobacteria bacterium]
FLSISKIVINYHLFFQVRTRATRDNELLFDMIGDCKRTFRTRKDPSDKDTNQKNNFHYIIFKGFSVAIKVVQN